MPFARLSSKRKYLYRNMNKILITLEREMMKDERQILLDNLHALFPTLRREQWTVERTAEGLTNHLYHCAATDGTKCMYRVYGVNTDRLIDRKKELTLLRCLGEQGLLARVLGCFPDALVYEFVEGRTLQTHESPSYQAEIAKRLAQFHNQATIAMSSTITNEKELVYNTLIRKWHDLLPEDIRHEYPLVQVQADHNGPIVFCHNDLLPANIILTPTQDVKFIDFEYAGWNPAAYDIANHLCEDITLSAEPSKLPNPKRIHDFVSVYNQHADQKVRPEDVQKYLPFVNLLWSIWARIQALSSHIDFDYVSYSQKRLQMYKSAL